jgi:hypothetical protein
MARDKAKRRDGCEECGSTDFFFHCHPGCIADKHVATCNRCGVPNLTHYAPPGAYPQELHHEPSQRSARVSGRHRARH